MLDTLYALILKHGIFDLCLNGPFYIQSFWTLKSYSRARVVLINHLNNGHAGQRPNYILGFVGTYGTYMLLQSNGSANIDTS